MPRSISAIMPGWTMASQGGAKLSGPVRLAVYCLLKQQRHSASLVKAVQRTGGQGCPLPLRRAALGQSVWRSKSDVSPGMSLAVTSMP